MPTEFQKFQLASDGRPIGLISPILADGAIALGFGVTGTMRFIQGKLKKYCVESRYYRDRNTHPITLQTRVDIAKDRPFCSLSLYFRKWVQDLTTEEDGYACTWHLETISIIRGFTMKQQAASVEQGLSSLLMEFAIEYHSANGSDSPELLGTES